MGNGGEWWGMVGNFGPQQRFSSCPAGLVDMCVLISAGSVFFESTDRKVFFESTDAAGQTVCAFQCVLVENRDLLLFEEGRLRF